MSKHYLVDLPVGVAVMCITTISFVVPIMGAIILSWIAHLPTAIHQELGSALGPHYKAGFIVGMIGCLIWIAAFFYATFSRQIDRSIASGYLVLLAIILWVSSEGLISWNTEAKLSAEVLSAPTVRNGCKQIRVFQCLVLVILSLLALFFLSAIAEKNGLFNHSSWASRHPRATATASLSNTNNVRTEDGAEERLPHPDLVRRKGDLEGGSTDDTVPQELSDRSTSSQKQAKSGVELTNMAAMDGAN